MAAPLLIVPGTNETLLAVARQLKQTSDVYVLQSANDALWQSRQAPPQVVLAAVQLSDMSGAELAEILPNFAPNARVFVCGTASTGTIDQIERVGAQFVALRGSAAENMHTIYRALGMEPPQPDPPAARAQAPVADQPPPVAPSVAASKAAPPAASTTAAATPAPVPASTATPAKRPPAERAPDQFSGMGTLIMQPQQYSILTKLLDLLLKEIRAQCVLLIDSAGMVLVRSGELRSVTMEVIAPLLATSFSTTGQLARQLQDPQSTAVYIHEGERYDVYAFNLRSRLSLIVMFDKTIEAGSLGAVWAAAQRSMRQLQQILKL